MNIKKTELQKLFNQKCAEVDQLRRDNKTLEDLAYRLNHSEYDRGYKEALQSVMNLVEKIFTQKPEYKKDERY